MAPFKPPDIDRLKERGNVKGLTKALRHAVLQNEIQEAASALREIGTDKAITALISCLLELGKDEVFKQGWIQAAITRIGERAIDPLAQALERGERRDLIIRTMGLIDSDSIGDILNGLLDNNDFRRVAAEVLAWRKDDRAVPPLMQMAQSNWELDIKNSIFFLGKMGTPRSHSALLELLDHDSPLVKKGACAALIETERDTVIPVVVDLLDVVEGHLCLEMMELIGKEQIYDALPKLIEILADSQRGVERCYAAFAVGKLPLSGGLEIHIPYANLQESLAKFILEEVGLCNAGDPNLKMYYGDGIKTFVNAGGKKAILDFMDHFRDLPDPPGDEEEYWLQFITYGGQPALDAQKEWLDRS